MITGGRVAICRTSAPWLTSTHWAITDQLTTTRQTTKWPLRLVLDWAVLGAEHRVEQLPVTSDQWLWPRLSCRLQPWGEVGRSVAGAACGGELSTVQPGSQVMGSVGLLAAVSRVQSLTQGSDWLLVQPATGLQLHNRRDGGHQWGIVVWPRQLFLNQVGVAAVFTGTVTVACNKLQTLHTQHTTYCLHCNHYKHLANCTDCKHHTMGTVQCTHCSQCTY